MACLGISLAQNEAPKKQNGRHPRGAGRSHLCRSEAAERKPQSSETLPASGPFAPCRTETRTTWPSFSVRMLPSADM